MTKILNRIIEKIELLEPQQFSILHSKEFMVEQLYYHTKWWNGLSEHEKHKIMKILEKNESK